MSVFTPGTANTDSINLSYSFRIAGTRVGGDAIGVITSSTNPPFNLSQVTRAPGAASRIGIQVASANDTQTGPQTKAVLITGIREEGTGLSRTTYIFSEVVLTPASVGPIVYTVNSYVGLIRVEAYAFTNLTNTVNSASLITLYFQTPTPTVIGTFRPGSYGFTGAFEVPTGRSVVFRGLRTIIQANCELGVYIGARPPATGLVPLPNGGGMVPAIESLTGGGPAPFELSAVNTRVARAGEIVILGFRPVTGAISLTGTLSFSIV